MGNIKFLKSFEDLVEFQKTTWDQVNKTKKQLPTNATKKDWKSTESKVRGKDTINNRLDRIEAINEGQWNDDQYSDDDEKNSPEFYERDVRREEKKEKLHKDVADVRRGQGRDFNPKYEHHGRYYDKSILNSFNDLINFTKTTEDQVDDAIVKTKDWDKRKTAESTLSPEKKYKWAESGVRGIERDRKEKYKEESDRYDATDQIHKKSSEEEIDFEKGDSNFDKMVEKLKGKGHSEESARKISYAIGKKKFGKKGMAAKSAAGRK